MNNITAFCHLLENDDTNFLLRTRLTFEWDEPLYQQTFSTLKKAMAECITQGTIPTQIYFFYTVDIPHIIGMIQNDLFTNIVESYLPQGIQSKEAFRQFIDIRIAEMQQQYQLFIDGDIMEMI